jgi:tRNA1(Val) A37 N6-methylase TrmN6
MIFPASRTVDLFVALRQVRLEPKRLQFVHPHRGKEAELILIESIKASGVELKIMAPLMLHESDKRGNPGTRNEDKISLKNHSSLS